MMQSFRLREALFEGPTNQEGRLGPRSADRGNDGVIGGPPCQAHSLQWGRDQLIAEIWQFAQRRRGHGTASMGPRSADRGNAFTAQNLLAAQQASMGPRSADRGNAARSSAARHAASGLQWGRDQLIAEIFRAGHTIIVRIQLQWGRDQLIAEMVEAF